MIVGALHWLFGSYYWVLWPSVEGTAAYYHVKLCRHTPRNQLKLKEINWNRWDCGTCDDTLSTFILFLLRWIISCQMWWLIFAAMIALLPWTREKNWFHSSSSLFSNGNCIWKFSKIMEILTLKFIWNMKTGEPILRIRSHLGSQPFYLDLSWIGSDSQ